MRIMKGKNQYTQNPSESRLMKLEKREETLLRRALNKEKVRQKRVERDMARKDKQSNKQKPHPKIKTVNNANIPKSKKSNTPIRQIQKT